VASILEDKRPELMLEALSVLGDEFVATESSSGRALGVAHLARHATPFRWRVHAIQAPGQAVRRARELAGTEGAVLVTGSLYLLADLYKEENVRWRTSATG
jgi:dihydrofolate synthase/folylpolyglutamate synthase